MGEGLRQRSRATWLRDARTPARRMRASWHPDAGVVVLSTWADDLCTATFRLPIDDAPELMHLLIDAFADPSLPDPPTGVRIYERIWSRICRLVRRRAIASVVPLRRAG